MLGALVYLTLLGIDTVENSCGLQLIPIPFTRNIQYFGLSSIYVIFDINKTSKGALKLANQRKPTNLMTADLVFFC